MFNIQDSALFLGIISMWDIEYVTGLYRMPDFASSPLLKHMFRQYSDER